MAAALLLSLICHPVCAQVLEDFSDGDFSNNPTWTGDTSKFRVNSNQQLQLYTTGADSAQLSFTYAMPLTDTIIWDFWLKLGFTPTSNNYAVVALYSDEADLLAATHYLSLAVSDPTSGSKEINMYQDDSLVMTLPYHPTLSSNQMRFKVQLTNTVFTVWLDSTGGNNPTLMGSADAATSLLPPEAHFGVYCHFTASRSTNFWFDDIGINSHTASPAEPDTTHNYRPLHGDIVVNEILFNPPVGGSDYVELYNRCDSAISLTSLRLARIDGDSVTRLYTLASGGTLSPHDFVAVTTDRSFVMANYNVVYPEKLVETATMPSYNDDKGIVALYRDDTVLIDRFDYTADMHSHLLRDKEGVALERRSADAPTQDAANWYSAASTARYGTPGYRNSQSHEFLFVDDDITIALPLFSPDGDGYNDLLDITYRLQQCDLSCNINIYDAQGRLVRHLLRGAIMGCDGVISWDGTDDGGSRCLRGNYVVVAEMYNNGGTIQKWRRRITLVFN